MEAWLNGLEAAEAQFNRLITEAGEEAISALHEIRAAISSLLKTSEDWVYSFPGESVDDKLSAAPDEVRRIYQTCQVIVSLLQLTDIIANPSAAQYGQPSPLSVYKLFDLLVKVFESRAADRQLGLQMVGSSFNRPRVYRSFGVIPLVLIDNAIKYAKLGSEVRIAVNDRPGGRVSVSITSQGEPIPNTERDRLFQRGFRATGTPGHGSGLGLYVADVVAKANLCPIQYSPRVVKGRVKLNEFSCLVGDVPVNNLTRFQS